MKKSLRIIGLLALALSLSVTSAPPYGGFINSIGMLNGYYVDPSSSGGDGTTKNLLGSKAAFKTMAAALAALTGDQHDKNLYLRCGQYWLESVPIAASGISGHPFNIDSYGSGARPIIDCCTTITGFSANTSYNPGTPAGSATGNENFRSALPANSFIYNSTQIRISITGGANLTTVTGAFVGQKAASGDAYDMEPGTIIQVTFDGNNTYALANGETKYSDWMTYSFDKTKEYITSIGTTGGYHVTSGGDGHNNYFKDNAQADAGTADVTGYTANAQRFVLQSFDIFLGNNVWSKAYSTAPWKIFFNRVVGNKKTAINQLTSANDWYWEPNILYVYSATDPATLYTNPGIQGSAVRSGLSATGQSYVNVKNIDIQGAIGHGVDISGCTNFNLSNMNVVGSKDDSVWYINSSGVLTNVTPTYGYGDGISGNGTGNVACWYCTSHHNGFYEGGTGNSSGDGFTCHNSCVFSVYYSISYNNLKSGIAVTGSGGGNIWNNTLFNNFDATDIEGPGWYSNLGLGVEDIGGGTWNIRNNITYGHQYEVYILGTSGINSDYNCFDDSRKADYGGKCFAWNNVAMNWADFKAASGGDAHSLNVDPLMVNPSSFDFHLQTGSPCIGAGINLGLTKDYDGYPVPLSGAVDIGAFEKH